ncbi:calcium-binding protein, partial [Xanthomonas oryzae pv. oryzae]
MADTEQKKLAKISKLVHPFQKSAKAGKAGAKPTDIDDPQVYFDALSNAQDGFYPIGANGQWHGGIHFDTQTGNTLAQEDGIRCIGDGEVVAYQIDAKYPSIEYSAGKATYSRGFVLVRHRLELPPAPKQTAQPAPAG